MTDVNRDYHASVNFVASGRGQLDLYAVVSFTYAVQQGIPVSYQPGAALAVATNASANIVTATVGPSGGFLLGVQASGDTDGNYFLSINNVQIYRFFTNITNPDVDFTTSGQLTLAPGDVVALSCQNTGDVTANYNGTLFGAF